MPVLEVMRTLEREISSQRSITHRENFHEAFPLSDLLTGILMITAGCEKPAPPESPLASKIKRFAPTTITADTSALSQGDRAALAKLIEATKIFDELYLRQSWSGNLELLRKLQADTSPDGKEMLHYFNINMGPWSNPRSRLRVRPGRSETAAGSELLSR